jgi:hypothetical protein
MFKDYSKRNNLSNIDFLLYNYFKLLLSLSEKVIASLQESNKYLFLYSYTILYFMLPLYNYDFNSMDENILLDKIGELGSITIMDKHKVPRNVIDILNISKDIPLYQVLE